MEVSKLGMEMKIQTTVNYLNTLAISAECKETSRSAVVPQTGQGVWDPQNLLFQR